ncbi:MULTISPECIES: carbohydrate ABC transporter permease [Paenibacillus]|uniref:Sugar ABC transporter permease n=1 Tax=Paenibacillus vini TaxID=1476024 RepID=A0ABQ4MFE8_9BACL|nr:MULTISPECIES: sugar ABC transporter permease [Paenibacillus]MBQ4900761.1 sugar ABC transporter permease [Paenibacillus sp. Marseille-P2973]MDN4071048.1 sugar ABC transporter permease [Paenibacillus vini]GIP54130.1 sugar ABC transporter permease [Paenibacillus vini]
MEQSVISPGNRVKGPEKETQKLKRTSNWKKYMWGYLFLVPAIVIFIIFLWVPIIKGMVYSFYNIDFVKGNTFVGFDNYVKIFNNPDLWLSVKNTLYFMFLTLVMGFWVPIAAAIAISELKFFQGFARIAAYLPFVVPGVVLYGMWRWMYDPVGPINALLGWFGADPVSFISDGRFSMISIVFMETWQQFGSAMLIYLAGVLSIPRDWYEAAEIDGAGVWSRIKYITLPSMRSLIMLMLILQIIGTSQAYQSQLALLDGGPNKATLTYALFTVKNAFTQLDYGAGTALGVLMFVVLGILGIIQFKLNREEY